MLRRVSTISKQVLVPWSEVLHEIFEAQADARPWATAVVFGREQATYSELEKRANQFARHLRKKGMGRGSIVAIMLPKSLDIYAALLGILKAGAAYVPIDPGYPLDRVTYILENSGARVLVTTSTLAKHHQSFRGKVIRIDDERDKIEARGSARLHRKESGVCPRDLCYVIYTSGSTGRPKGVMIEHRSVCHLVRTETRIFEIRREDRVYQGASLSFDLSVEEIWLAFANGAALIAATPEMERAGPDLSRLLTQYGVTVLSCVPTLLSILATDVPTVHLLILGGEACPPPLVGLWAKPGRRMVNTYGPTETTIIGTYTDLSPRKPVTIGRALPGYRVHLLDDGLRPVSTGNAGEICIGGVGVARGYVGLPEQTKARFMPDPFAPTGDTDARLYRTGDLGRIDPEGNIEFLGRADAQVKLRGFRIELTEIESVLMQADGLLAAACSVRESPPGVQQLVGYVVPRDGQIIDEESLRLHLHSRLPAYMVPALIEAVEQLPRLPNGKTDRALLPEPRPRGRPVEVRSREPRTDIERRIAEVWESLFSPHPVSVQDDFFLDLGGHSLLVAQMVSELRKNPQFGRVSVSDVYENPTIASLAAALESATTSAEPVEVAGSPQLPGKKHKGEGKRHFLASIFQAGALYFVFAFRGVQWITPYLVYFFLLVEGYSVLESALWAAASAVVILPILFLAAIAIKWLVLGRIRPGRHPVWGGYYLRWWFAQSLIEALPLDHLSGTPLLPIFYRLLGARIGKDVYIGTDSLSAFDLISIGDGSSIDDEASLLGYTVEEGELVVGQIGVGRGCFIGTWSVLRENTLMEDGARLEDLSLLPSGGRIPSGETWIGSPARRTLVQSPTTTPPPAPGAVRRGATVALYALLLLVFPIIYLAALFPGLAILTRTSPLSNPFLYLALTPLVGGSFVLVFTIMVVLLKWLLLGRVKAGTYPVHGSFYVRSWIVDQLLNLSLDVAGGLHATLYLAPWYRALGAKLGRFVELSTATSTIPDLIEIGDESTIADEASLGAARVEQGWMTLAPTRLGRRAFIGNSGVLPGGTSLGDESLIGVLSIAPTNPTEASRRGASWLGSPPILLPRRQPSTTFPERRTFRPSRKLRLARGSVELLRVTLPPAGFIIIAATVITAALSLWPRLGLPATILLLPAIYGACCVGVMGVVALAKWAIIGRFRPFEHPLWSTFIWRLEFVNSLYEFLVTPLGLEPIHGTPFLPAYLRVLGARIGRRTYIETTGFLEFDLVELGDRAALNKDCIMQTHLFEDRVLKASKLHVGADCSVGASSVVLYDSRMEDGTRLDAISLVMKGETLPGNTAWAGVPARRVK